MDQKYFDQIILEESKYLAERIKDYPPEKRDAYIEGYSRALNLLSELDPDLIIPPRFTPVSTDSS